MKQYTIKLNEKQLGLICRSVDIHAFLICGQLGIIQDFFEQAWERNNEYNVGSREWREMLKELECTLDQMRQKYWNHENGQYYGINYDDTADILFDIKLFCERAITKDKYCPSPISNEPPVQCREGTDLTWQDIRRIVKIADAELGRYTQDELAEMGEEKYYEMILKKYNQPR